MRFTPTQAKMEQLRLRQTEKPNTLSPKKEGGGLEDGLFSTLNFMSVFALSGFFAFVSPRAFTGNLGVNHQMGSNKEAILRTSPKGLSLLPDHRLFYSMGKYCLCPELNLPWVLSFSPEHKVLQTETQPLLTPVIPLPCTDKAASSPTAPTHGKPGHPRGGPCEEAPGTCLLLWLKENPSIILVSQLQNGVDRSCHALNH